MSISLARLNANRANAQQSTGPRTAEGKERSRQNALKHGLAGEGMVLPEEEAGEVVDRTERWSEILQPANDLEAWLVGRMAVAAVRLDRCHPQELAERSLKALRARSSWDEDRHLAAEQLAARLASDPHTVVRQLRQTKQGCEWLINAWQELQSSITPHGWSPADRAQALLLLGTPFGEAAFSVNLPEEPEALRQIARAEVATLMQLKTDLLDGLDHYERHLAETGARFDTSLPARLLARYEAMHWRAFQWTLSQLVKLREPQAEPRPQPQRQPAIRQEAQPAPLPRPRPQEIAQAQPQAEEPANEPAESSIPPVLPEASQTRSPDESTST